MPAPGAPQRLRAATALACSRSDCARLSDADGPPSRLTCACAAASASTVFGALTCGLDCGYSTAKGSLGKYAAACQFVQPDFTVGAKCEDKGGKKTLSCSYFHKVSGDMQLGVAIAKPLAKADVAIEFGTAYKLDKDTTVKSKVDSAGTLSASYKQKISPLTTMTLCAAVDVVNLADNKHKFGLALNITP